MIYNPDQYTVEITTSEVGRYGLSRMTLESYGWLYKRSGWINHYLGYYMMKQGENLDMIEPDDLKVQIGVYQRMVVLTEKLQKHASECLHANTLLAQPYFQNLLSGITLNGDNDFTIKQKMGALYSFVCKGCILGDEVGLGKTLTAILTYLILKKQKPHKKLIYVTKPHLVDNVRNEIQTFLSGVKALEYNSKTKKGNAAIFAYDWDILLLNLEKFRCDSENLSEIFNHLAKNNQLGCVVVDECTKLKTTWDGKLSQMTTKFMQIINKHYDKIDIRIGISGTPIENGISDIFNLYYFVDRSLLGSHYQWFAETFCEFKYRKIQRFGKWIPEICGIKGIKRGMENILKTFIKHKFLKRRHDSIGEVVFVTKPVYLTTAEMKKYNAILDSYEVPAESFYDLQHFLNTTASKQAVLEDVLDNVDGKAIIFTKHIEYGQETIMKMVGERGRTMVVNGRNKEKISVIEKKFHSHDFLLCTDCLSEGSNFQMANWVIHYELPMKATTIKQRNGRITRLGQTKTMYAVLIYVVGSIEEELLMKVRGKEELLGNFTDGLEEETYSKDVSTLRFRKFKV